MGIQNSNQTAQDAIHNFKSFLGKPRTELPWLNGTVKGFPNRIKGFYDCALGFSYISGLRPIQVSCSAVKHLAQANKVWNLDIRKVLPGDAVLFDWESKKGIGKNTNTDHIGMVISVDVKRKTVTYVSADTGKVIPGIVTVNTVGLTYVAGFARLVNFANPESVVPDLHQGQREVHSVTAAPANVVPEGAPVLTTLASAVTPAASATPAAPVNPQITDSVTTPAVPATPAAPALIHNPGYPGHYVKKGDVGDAVAYMQQQLHLPVTRNFDDALDHAVKQLQHKHGLTADGVVGPLTWKAIG
jgi:peptidoglycan hydrolase-like protein with peptidoglycan-binding domain